MDGPWGLGIEIGGTKLQLGLGRGDGAIAALERRSVPHRPDRPAQAEDIRREISDGCATLLARNGLTPDDLGAVGVGFGGPVDADRGVTLTSHQIKGWDEFPLADWLRTTLGVRAVSVQNDADTAAQGEARFGAGRGLSPIVYVTIGSGVGGGLVLDGQIYRGSGLGALEIGHLWVEPEEQPGGPTRCASRVEEVASGWGIARRAREELERGEAAELAASPEHSILRDCVHKLGGPAAVTAALVAEAAAQGDPLAGRVLGRATTVLGRALGHVVTLLAPRRIILGGGVSLIGEALWFEPIRRELYRRAFPAFRGACDVVPATLGEEVVVHGALALAHDAIAAPRHSEAGP